MHDLFEATYKSTLATMGNERATVLLIAPIIGLMGV
jgi:hypothetical protein